MLLQKDILKMIDKKENSIKYVRFEYFKTTAPENSYFNMGISNGHFIKFYNDKHFFINIDEISERSQAFDVNGIISNENLRELRPTNERINISVSGKAKTLIKFTFCDNGENLYCDEKYINYFITKYIRLDTYKFYALNGRNPLFLKLDNDINGIILPVNHNEK